MWWPNGDYEPIRPGERGTIGEAIESVPAIASGRPSFTPEREQRYGSEPTVRERTATGRRPPRTARAARRARLGGAGRPAGPGSLDEGDGRPRTDDPATGADPGDGAEHRARTPRPRPRRPRPSSRRRAPAPSGTDRAGAPTATPSPTATSTPTPDRDPEPDADHHAHGDLDADARRHLDAALDGTALTTPSPEPTQALTAEPTPFPTP